MSELKAFDITVAEEGYCEGIVKYRRAVYDKSEADKVIAELEEGLQAANEQIENLINSASRIMLVQDRVNDDKCAELRHSNYKRCLAWAQWCMDARCETEQDAKFLVKWEHRWLTIANKFKEVK